MSAAKPYFGIFGPCKLFLVVNASSYLKLIIHLIQTWGELIVNANALLMHYFFPVIQGND